MRFLFAVLMVFCLFFSCSDKKQQQIDVSKVKVDFSVKRYDVDFYNATTESLLKVKQKYPYLFPDAFTDSLAFAKINDKEEQKLFAETQKIYADFNDEEKQFSSLFKHVKYYNPKFKVPNVVTLLSNIDYENRVIYADSLMLVSLDVYLGKQHQFYADYPKYIKENNTKKHIIVDVASAIIEQQVQPSNKRRFIDKMIYEGKKMYLLDSYLPEVSDQEIMGYSEDKFNWAIANEEQVWMYFIDKKLLFSTDTKLNQRFLDNAPFSKFYTDQDNLSPGKIGVWLGWQIVNSYMQHNDVSLQELLKMDEDVIFTKSKYKPKR
ncbi:gliding motility lipoprotein GldB [Polaribacter reichenbachii]|uniref:Gliding motility lipoprotein GldB n=1 Tax=Polaribacter reichenbachii TaxID=996801 RepID=A0A1B8TVW8_9FLAO|nr:gliding motility lipoprotein GldB [Polaribacter reichenbachii]APZ45233.1 gliding motility lipoprotein GldB [Polaribacter reichenbachii]AUC19096.1 gliding motility lipoprotein GldB [Polaribacter reichenbachii]OBY63748.1 gliding motility lipoprotein GldB [Polaribacter reichenbachii]